MRQYYLRPDESDYTHQLEAIHSRAIDDGIDAVVHYHHRNTPCTGHHSLFVVEIPRRQWRRWLGRAVRGVQATGQAYWIAAVQLERTDRRASRTLRAVWRWRRPPQQVCQCGHDRNRHERDYGPCLEQINTARGHVDCTCPRYAGPRPEDCGPPGNPATGGCF